MATEMYSNPLHPEVDDGHGQERLTNADFRKLLSTPRPDGKGGSDRTQRGFLAPRDYSAANDSAAEQRRKKKSFYAKLKKQEMERQAELAKKYRDRSKERREGKGDYADVELLSTTADYRAVGPTTELDRTSAEKRRQVIQESKFLGGDMAHTHLVKGLDFALLQKVRAEISNKERENEEILDEILEKDKAVEEVPAPKENVFDGINNKMAKNIYRMLFQKKVPHINESFLPGRMAYVFDLEDEISESDLPTTLMRSKADCPNLEVHTTLSTNDIVINKLTQILAYLRQGSKDKHKRKKDKKHKSDGQRPVEADFNIFDDAGEYVPSSKPKKHSKVGVGPYFEKSAHKQEEENLKSMSANAHASVKQLVKNVHEQQTTKDKKKQNEPKVAKDKSGGNPLVGGNVNLPDSYAECYPSTQFNVAGVGEDSDDEADYSKMDMGSKKGPVGRWDFDTQEEYSSYMSKREALPKAAFQYGIKMSGGRKTRRTREQNEKQKLNRELQQIQQIITKRKGSSRGEESFKKPKY